MRQADILLRKSKILKNIVPGISLEKSMSINDADWLNICDAFFTKLESFSLKLLGFTPNAHEARESRLNFPKCS